MAEEPTTSGEEILDMALEGIDVATEVMNLVTRRLAEGASVATIGAGFAAALSLMDLDDGTSVGTAIRKIISGNVGTDRD